MGKIAALLALAALILPVGGSSRSASISPATIDAWSASQALPGKPAPNQPLPTNGQVNRVFGWPLPLPVQVARPFDRPAEKWLAGHRGVDLTGPLAAPVLAPGAGTVSHNGWIVDRHVLVIDHGDLRSTLEPVVSDLAVGTTVLRGQAVGKLVTSEASHCPSCLHWGVRQGQNYLDPMQLLSASPRAVLWK